MSTPPTNEQPHVTSNEDIDFDLLDYLQTLTPAERIQRNDAALELVRAGQFFRFVQTAPSPEAHGRAHGTMSGR